MPSTKRPCKHSELLVEVSSHAAEARFKHITYLRRLAATTPSGRAPARPDGSESQDEAEAAVHAQAFPAPLVLPGDDLALDPRYPPQSLRSWINGNWRHKFTKNRKTLFIAASPVISDKLRMMKRWSVPIVPRKSPKTSKGTTLEPPNTGDVVEYMRAFYHGLPVEPLNDSFEFVQWDDGQTTTARARKAKKTSQASTAGRAKNSDPYQFVGLRWGDGCTRVRTRPCPDGAFERQLNLSDILDAVLEMVPPDAYSVLLLMDQDLYEDEDDDFCCGRAYGGSRVAIVSTARYHPSHDTDEIDHLHMWPASHCQHHVRKRCDLAVPKSTKPKRVKRSEPETELIPVSNSSSPMRSALDAVSSLPAPTSPTDLHGLWFSRVARTASHELGHCLGIDHCTYYACCMQGTAGLVEDCQQPPYLCPVCLKKLLHAVRELIPQSGEDEWVASRYRALLDECGKWQNIAMFAGYQAWLKCVLDGMRRP